MTNASKAKDARTATASLSSPLHGGDRGGLNAEGWAEVPADGIGGHPELEMVTPAGVGGLNGPQPETDPATGAPLAGRTIMKDGYVKALEARVSAHRTALEWIVRHLSAKHGAQMLADLNEPYPPQDGQEDPGAVPVEEFGATAAYSQEIRTILEPLKRR